ncbi:MAG: hypothetical protein GX640_19240 [Fibrobacter sp.]|nr:hypothetical protein [Fibrobacter sp.]
MLNPSECTLYSGGHLGAETFFGECAERWGIKEVTFSYNGHFIKREKNVIMLSDEELKRGDVSMEIVSLHMHRQYAHSDQIKRVLQTLFHMVNHGMQIFAIGIIQDDNTVKGGTGWGVELGKFFNRNVHVFDKDRCAWFSWRHDEWVMDKPVIHEKTFCGTGSRELTDESISAIEELFYRSFGKGIK